MGFCISPLHRFSVSGCGCMIVQSRKRQRVPSRPGVQTSEASSTDQALQRGEDYIDGEGRTLSEEYPDRNSLQRDSTDSEQAASNDEYVASEHPQYTLVTESGELVELCHRGDEPKECRGLLYRHVPSDSALGGQGVRCLPVGSATSLARTRPVRCSGSPGASRPPTDAAQGHRRSLNVGRPTSFGQQFELSDFDDIPACTTHTILCAFFDPNVFGSHRGRYQQEALHGCRCKVFANVPSAEAVMAFFGEILQTACNQGVARQVILDNSMPAVWRGRLNAYAESGSLRCMNGSPPRLSILPKITWSPGDELMKFILIFVRSVSVRTEPLPSGKRKEFQTAHPERSLWDEIMNAITAFRLARISRSSRKDLQAFTQSCSVVANEEGYRDPSSLSRIESILLRPSSESHQLDTHQTARVRYTPSIHHPPALAPPRGNTNASPGRRGGEGTDSECPPSPPPRTAVTERSESQGPANSSDATGITDHDSSVQSTIPLSLAIFRRSLEWLLPSSD